MEATAQAGQALQAASAAGGAGRAGAVGQLGACVAGGPAGELVLISIHDDATSRLMAPRFVERYDGAENRRAIIGYLQRHGRPLAVYTDHAGHFGQWLTKRDERTDTIISRALGELGVEVILAGSPQAALALWTVGRLPCWGS